MVVYANLLFPLYIYPINNAWQPFIDAAKAYPDVTFTAVINPNSGPDPVANGCPNNDYVGAIASLNALPNVYTMGYVHTANRYDCGPGGFWGKGTDICPCSRPIAQVKNDTLTYAKWKKLKCNGWGTSPQDVHIDSLFIDESPGQDSGRNFTYMRDLTKYAKSQGIGNVAAGGSVLFNAGTKPDRSYFNISDAIVIVENTLAEYKKVETTIDDYNYNTWYNKSSIILYAAPNNEMPAYVDEILNKKHNNFPSLFMTDKATDQYSQFPGNWNNFTYQMNQVAQKNKACLKDKSCS